MVAADRSDGMMRPTDAAGGAVPSPRRPIRRLHFSTLAIAVAVAAVFAALNWGQDFDPVDATLLRGWPLVWHDESAIVALSGRAADVHLWRLSVNLGIALLAVAAAAALFEVRRRHRRRIWQFSLRDALALVLLASLASAWWAQWQGKARAARQAVGSLEAGESISYSVTYDTPADWFWQACRVPEDWRPKTIVGLSIAQITDEEEGPVVPRELPPLSFSSLVKLRDQRWLVLGDCSLTADQLREIAALPRLEALALHRCLVADDALEPLRQAAGLQVLTLPECGLTDAGLRHLSSLCELETLEVPGNRGITDAGLEHLRRLKKLRFLDLTNTGVTEQAVDRLREALPELEVTDD
ncbi:MAG: hypothetical protein HYS13_14765 [Planctomycetia bacterium]|nr:hypothetical protein [Planctomycetia bacterium]